MPRALRWLLILITLGLIHANPSAAQVAPIYIQVAPNANIGAGFGEMPAGLHDLRIILQGNTADGGIYAYLMDSSGNTIWEHEGLPGGNSLTMVGYGVAEDQMGLVSGFGYFMSADPMNPAMVGFNVTLANALFPCASSACNPMTDPMGCTGTNGCATTREGEIFIVPDTTQQVTVTVHHASPGTLTVTAEGSNIDLVGSTTVRLDGINTATFTVHAAPSYTGQAQLRCRFVHDNGPLATEDILKVKKGTVKLDRIIVDATDPEDLGPVAAYIGNAVPLRAMPKSVGARFDPDPTWEVIQKPNNSTVPNPGPAEVIVFTPDLEGSYILEASAGGTSDIIEVIVVSVTVDLDVDSNNDGSIADDDDPIEELSPGRLLWVNGAPIAGEHNERFIRLMRAESYVGREV